MTSQPSERPLESGRGRDAERPRHIPLSGLKDVLWRVWREFGEDRVMLIAAGASFYLLLALFPALAAFVSMFGFMIDPVELAEQIATLEGLLPTGGIELMTAQVESLAEQTGATLSFGAIAGLAIALWSATYGIKTLFEAMNIAYDEHEERSFLRLNALAILFTLGAMAIALMFLLALGVVPALLRLVGLSDWTERLISLARWPVLVATVAAGTAIIYRYGPSRVRPRWRWVMWGSAIATAAWVVTSIGFSWYLQNVADYNATYGSLGAAVGFMMWTWLSMVILIVGAELNAELEHQTAIDSTVGPDRPMGERGARMADTLGVVAGTQRRRSKLSPFDKDKTDGA